MPDAQVFALALRGIDGVGRVTASRLVEHFPTYDALRRCPREQILFRLKGTARAADLVALLLDEDQMLPRLDAAADERAALQARNVNLRAPADPDWPAALNRLPRSERPFLLFLYGNTRLLAAPGVAFFGKHGLATGAFELAQALVRHIVARHHAPWVGLHDGFDVALAKTAALAPAPCVLVAACGLSKVAPPMRPVAAQVVRAGGLMVSPFEMEHGPFEHDARDRARLAVALTRAAVLCDAELDTGTSAALATAQSLGTPLYALDARLAEAHGLPLLSQPGDLSLG